MYTHVRSIFQFSVHMPSNARAKATRIFYHFLLFCLLIMLLLQSICVWVWPMAWLCARRPVYRNQFNYIRPNGRWRFVVQLCAALFGLVGKSHTNNVCKDFAFLVRPAVYRLLLCWFSLRRSGFFNPKPNYHRIKSALLILKFQNNSIIARGTVASCAHFSAPRAYLDIAFGFGLSVINLSLAFSGVCLPFTPCTIMAHSVSPFQ